MAQVKPMLIFNEYFDTVNLIFEFCYADDPVISTVALETIGYIATNKAGKLALKQCGKSCENSILVLFSKSVVKYFVFAESQMLRVLRTLGQMIALQTTERKVIALNVLANLLHLKVSLMIHSQLSGPLA